MCAAIGIGAVGIEHVAVVVGLTHPLVAVASFGIHGVDSHVTQG